MEVIAIALVARNGVIGDGAGQPFSFVEDWRRFKAVTLGHPLVMGRRTVDAIGRYLPGRTTIVVTRHPGRVVVPEGADARVVGSVAEALSVAAALDDIVYVAGGGTIYQQAWPYLTALDLTEVHADAAGDVRFPVVDPAEWAEVRRQPGPEFDFVGYRRRSVARPLPERQ
nr:dihydrofolate reductase [Propionibacterium sp.]